MIEEMNRKVLSDKKLLQKIKHQNPDGRFVYKEDEDMEKPFDWGQITRLMKYMKPYRWQLLPVVIVMMVLGSLTKLAIPFLIALAIDKAIANQDVPFLTTLVSVMVGLYIIQWLANRYRIRLTNYIGQRVIHDLRSDLFKHIQQLSFSFFDKRPAGSVLVRITNDVNSLQDLFTNGVINIIMDIVLLLGIIIIMLTLNWKLAIAIMITVPFMFMLSTQLRKRIRRAWQDVRQKQARINAHLNESIQGIRVTQAYTQEKENMKFFAAMNDENSLAWRVATRRSDSFGPLVEITGALGTCVLFWFGAYLLQTGGIDHRFVGSFCNLPR